MIAEAIDKVGKDGVITVEESQTFGMEMDLVEGMRFDKGYISPYFVTDQERMEAVARGRLHPARQLEDHLGARPAAGAREGHAGRQAPRDHRRGRRGRGPRHAGRQQDPRHVRLGRRQGPRLRRPPQGDAAGHGHPHRRPGHHRRGRPQAREHHPRPARPGRQGHRLQGRDHRSSRAGAPRTTSTGRINQIKAEIENTDSDYDREKLQERLAKLSGGVAVLKVGAATEVELKEKKHRIEDAVSTTKAAIEEGVVAGGGVTLLRAQKAVQDCAAIARRRRGHRCPHRGPCAGGAAQADRRQRRRGGRRGRREGARASTGNRATTPPPATTRTWSGKGIIDAAKVTRSALQNAASIAALFLTTEAVITDAPEKRRRAPPAACPEAWTTSEPASA